MARGKTGTGGTERSGSDDRAERLKAALRANLTRRKAQARRRDTTGDPGASDGTGASGATDGRRDTGGEMGQDGA